jgi:hypothetical protein
MAYGDISYNSIDGVYLTLKVDNSTIVYEAESSSGSQYIGRAVSILSSDTASLADDDGHIAGQLKLVEPDGTCNVQIRGVMVFPVEPNVNPATVSVGVGVVSSPNGYVIPVDNFGNNIGEAWRMGRSRGTIVRFNEETMELTVIF